MTVSFIVLSLFLDKDILVIVPCSFTEDLKYIRRFKKCSVARCLLRKKTGDWATRFLTTDTLHFCCVNCTISVIAHIEIRRNGCFKNTLQTSVHIQTFLCVHTCILTAATNRSRGMIALAQFGCPPKWCRKSLFRIVLNWTTKRCPGAGFRGAACLVSHIFCDFLVQRVYCCMCVGGRVKSCVSICRITFFKGEKHVWPEFFFNIFWNYGRIIYTAGIRSVRSQTASENRHGGIAD